MYNIRSSAMYPLNDYEIEFFCYIYCQRNIKDKCECRNKIFAKKHIQKGDFYLTHSDENKDLGDIRFLIENCFNNASKGMDYVLCHFRHFLLGDKYTVYCSPRRFIDYEVKWIYYNKSDEILTEDFLRLPDDTRFCSNFKKTISTKTPTNITIELNTPKTIITEQTTIINKNFYDIYESFLSTTDIPINNSLKYENYTTTIEPNNIPYTNTTHVLDDLEKINENDIFTVLSHPINIILMFIFGSMILFLSFFAFYKYRIKRNKNKKKKDNDSFVYARFKKKGSAKARYNVIKDNSDTIYSEIKFSTREKESNDHDDEMELNYTTVKFSKKKKVNIKEKAENIDDVYEDINFLKKAKSESIDEKKSSEPIYANI